MNTGPVWRLRKLQEPELDALYQRRMEKDFPSAERPSLKAMHRHIQQGLQTVYILTDGFEDAGYAVCAEANAIALITLLAIFPEKRGGGVGTRMLDLLKQLYRGERAIMLEVEAPEDAESEEDRSIRERRIAFYERSGYQLLSGIRHDSFGIHLLLMALPIGDTIEAIRASAVEDIRAIYRIILPEERWPFVTTTEEPPR